MPARAPFHLMTKPMGSKCNLDCTYCFYLEKERLYPGSSGFRMKPEVLEAYVRDYIAAQPGPVVSFAWQGGEPTLAGVDFFRTAVALQQRYAGGLNIENAFQTNGTLLDDEWGAFLAEHKFLVGLSVDGPAHLHDAYRVDRGGQPTFAQVMRGLEVLKKHHVEFNTLTTVHRKNSRQALEVYRFLRNCGSGYLQFIPIVERNAAEADASGLWLAPPPDYEDATMPTDYISLNADCVSTVTNTTPKPYDHVMLNPAFTTEIDGAYGFQVVDLVKLMKPYWKGPKKYPGGPPYKHNPFRAAYSDHSPVVFRIKVPAQDDD